jgi:hypothetical protein
MNTAVNTPKFNTDDDDGLEEYTVTAASYYDEAGTPTVEVVKPKIPYAMLAALAFVAVLIFSEKD